MRSVSRTTSRDAEWGNFAHTMFYDGQGFMAHKDLGISNIPDLKGATVCVIEGTTWEKNLLEFSRRNGLRIQPADILWTPKRLRPHTGPGNVTR